jgi:hypothetical protein
MQPSADSLQSHDRCPRKAFYEKTWVRQTVSPLHALYAAVEHGLTCEEKDPGIAAGDRIMTLAAERGLAVPANDQYTVAEHYAALADLITFTIRTGAPWRRPEPVRVGKAVWEPSCFLAASGARLKRIVLVDRWSDERTLSESHSWKSVGEAEAYCLPMTQTVVVIGQHREGRRHSPWSKAWIHPVVTSQIRMRKRSGEPFSGKWRQIWREDEDYNRETWLEAMTSDGILGDVLFETEVPVPEGAGAGKIRRLMERKLMDVEITKVLPDPRPSVCDWPVPCPFNCWSFEQPSERNGFVRLSELSENRLRVPQTDLATPEQV